MSMDEAARHELFEQLPSTLGEEAVATLMAHLPPFDWTELVTKDYLDDRLELLEQRIMAAFRAELNTAITAQTRTIMYAAIGGSIGSAAVVGTLVLAATQLS